MTWSYHSKDTSTEKSLKVINTLSDVNDLSIKKETMISLQQRGHKLMWFHRSNSFWKQPFFTKQKWHVVIHNEGQDKCYAPRPVNTISLPDFDLYQFLDLAVCAVMTLEYMTTAINTSLSFYVSKSAGKLLHIYMFTKAKQKNQNVRSQLWRSLRNSYSGSPDSSRLVHNLPY